MVFDQVRTAVEALREGREQTGFEVEGDFAALGLFKLLGGKRLHVFAVEGDCNAVELRRNAFEMAWPPQSGRRQSFPEVDGGGWFGEDTALLAITKGQRAVPTAFSLAAPPRR